MIAIAGLFAGALDPLANWATFAVFDPRMLHFPFSWPYVDIAPNLEPALSFLGGYAAYYLLNGLGMLAAHNRLVAPLLRRTGWLAGRPLCGGIPPEITRPYLRRVADAGQLAEAG